MTRHAGEQSKRRMRATRCVCVRVVRSCACCEARCAACHLDASDEEGARLLDGRHQPRQLPLELLADRRHLPRRPVVLRREDCARAAVGAAREHVVQVARQPVGVLLEHAAAVVHDVARVVPDQEGGGVDRLDLARPGEDARAALALDDLREELLVSALRHPHLRRPKRSEQLRRRSTACRLLAAKV